VALYVALIMRFFIKIGKKVPYKEPELNKKLSYKKIPENLDYIIIGTGMGGLLIPVHYKNINFI
jgi:hypothetical protein